MESSDGFSYRTRILAETIGGMDFRFECLEDLNRTIDELFEELQRRGEPQLLDRYCPYFGMIWPSARALGQVVASWGSELEGKSVLELGCGLALPGIIASRLGASVKVTDTHPDVPLFLKRNQVLNGAESLEYQELDWNSGQTKDLIGRRFERVIASDVLYERTHPAELAPVLDSLVSPTGIAVVTDPGRPYLQEFANEMTQRGFGSEIAILPVPDHGVEVEIIVLTFRRDQ